MLPEVESYLERIEDLCGQIIKLIGDLPSEALNWRPIEGEGEHGTNSLAVLAAHVAGAERFWIGESLGNRPPSRVREAEFAVKVADASDLVRGLEEAEVETREVLSTLTRDDLEGVRQVRGRAVPVRWCILHVIDHTALHLGHMQLTYQLWIGGQGLHSPRWFERLESRK